MSQIPGAHSLFRSFFFLLILSVDSIGVTGLVTSMIYIIDHVINCI